MTKRKTKGVPGDEPVKSKKSSSGDNSGKRTVVHLADNLTVSEIKSVHKELSRYLKGSGILVIDASGVQAIDTAGLQVLLAFTNDIGGRGRPVEWQSPSTELLETVELLDMKEALGL